ncbi:MAG: asparagine synthetase B family protein [Gemmatimonadales bacterium]
MLIGAAGPLAQTRTRVLAAEHLTNPGISWVGSGRAVAAIVPWKIPGFDRLARGAQDEPTGSWLALSGRPLPERAPPADGGVAGWILQRLLAHGPSALAELDGAFAIAWFDGRSGLVHLVRDRFGIEPFYYAPVGASVLFGSRVSDLRGTGLLPDRVSGQGLAEFLVFGYVPGHTTLDEGVLRVRPGFRLEIDPGGVWRSERWYRLSFAGPQVTDEREVATRFRTLLERATERRLDGGGAPGVLLSGGMDSSAVFSLARRHHAGTIRTYAFRCPGRTFDESYYARELAAFLQAEHAELEYGEVQALEQRALVEEMEVPFCNIGINVGTWLLGRAAGGQATYLLSGDGGDELWGSHPVYAAQRLMRYYDALPIPRLLHRGLHAMLNLVSDSDRKRDLRVTLKRILPRDGLPKALGPFRWLAQYTIAELRTVLTPEAAVRVRDVDPFRSVLDAYEGYDGPDDGLSPHLYNDYLTASGYYFSRLSLVRRFGLEPRLPFYDRDLVEFGAHIPARLKVEGVERTKRLFRVAMKGIVPDLILDRKDKLGHSIPVKNWLREDGVLARDVARTLSNEAIERRGLFRPDAVRRLWDEHHRRRHNHSHRLWGLYTLELWLRAREARSPAPAASATA